MTIREQQDKFIDNMALFDNWTDRFNYLISESEWLPKELPSCLRSFRIEGCQSKTCFWAERDEHCLRVNGWSNSAVMGGIIVCVMKMFNLSTIEEYQPVDIDFHLRSGLIDNLTPMRRTALEEIVRRIIVLLPCKPA
jgi:cysteine desulfuration protein SufE